MTLYSIILFVLFFLAFRTKNSKELQPFGVWTYSFAFIIKIIAGILFLFIYSFVYSEGKLSFDANFFMIDSEILHQVFSKSPVDYFKLLFGIGNTDQLTIQYLQETTHWDSGESKIINDNRFVIRIHSLIHFISNGKIIIHLLVMSVISTFALKQFYKSIVNYSLLPPKIIFISLLFFPSLLFWSSSILKEPILLFGFSLFIRALLDEKLKNKRIFYFIFSILILVNIKPYVLLIGLLSILTFFIFNSLNRFKTIGTFTILSLSIVLFFTLFPSNSQKIIQTISKKQFDFLNVGKGGLHALTKTDFYYFNPNQIQDLKIEGDSVWITKPIDAILIHKESNIETRKKIHLTPNGEKWFVHFNNIAANGLIPVTPINNSLLQLIKNIPESIINALFRPLPTDPGGKMKHLAFIETFFLFSFLILSFFQRKKTTAKEKSIIFSISVFVILLSLLIGWTTPVLGAIVRYRIPAYIGVLFIALILYAPKSSSE